ncbi:MAG TPA: prepilin-type N-terminal cleavage/methylation domain-containing protein [Candidatus Acidoferrales bacterium]|nr:prepilin-type N-terminal cleavage/methylation domain-containing protein [Candidatus Acidoferrales bacterium]
MNRKQKGFSLIELLIVVAIILIIAAIAIPNLLRSKMAANEASAVGSLRTILTANVTFNSTYGVGFANNLGVLGSPNPPPAVATCAASELLDPVLSAAITAGTAKSGYFFTYAGATAFTGVLPAGCAAGWQTFDVSGVPAVPGTTGQRTFCIDQTGVIRDDPTGGIVVAAGVSCAADGYPNSL